MKRSVRVLGHDLDAVRATRDIRGIGFKTPAEIAMKLGIEKPGSWGHTSRISAPLVRCRHPWAFCSAQVQPAML